MTIHTADKPEQIHQNQDDPIGQEEHFNHQPKNSAQHEAHEEAARTSDLMPQAQSELSDPASPPTPELHPEPMVEAQSDAEARRFAGGSLESRSWLAQRWLSIIRRPPAWQRIIWREWRYTEDETYARHLFDLVADERAGIQAAIFSGLKEMIYGGTIGLMISLIGGLDGTLTGRQIGLWMLSGAVTGLIVVSVVRFLMGNRLTWREWLTQFDRKMSSAEVGLLGAVLLASLINLPLAWAAGRGWVMSILTLSILLLAYTGARILGWLIRFENRLQSVNFNRYRKICFWWQERPYRHEVKAALPQAFASAGEAKKDWMSIIHRLEQPQKQSDSPEKLIAQLQDRNWVVRCTAAYLLVDWGGEAVPHLEPIAKKRSSLLRRTALGLLHSISEEATAHLAQRASRLLCARCLTRFKAHSIRLPEDETLIYYGCRVCRQSREFWEGEGVAVLDATPEADISAETGSIRVNWLARRTLFDFDRVEIIQATDEAVERFAIQVGNDTDSFRAGRYQTMVCSIDPACDLSDNTLRILGRIFGGVETIGR